MLTTYNSAIGKAKRYCFWSLCERIEDTTKSPRLSKVIAEKKAIPPVELQREDVTFEDNEEGRVHLFLGIHFSGSYQSTTRKNKIGNS